MEIAICSQSCQDYCFIVLDIFLALTTSQAITLVRTSWKLMRFVVWFIGVFIMIVKYDAVEN